MNQYNYPHPVLIHSGQFWRCRHGRTTFMPCWRCGLWHPIRYFVHVRAVNA